MTTRILASARQHGIEDWEIRAVIGFYGARLPVAAIKPGALLWLYIGPPADNEPWIEVIADHSNEPDIVVFHAMMLRPSTVSSNNIEGVDPTYARQRK